MALTPSGPPAQPAFCATSSRLSNHLIDTSRVRILFIVRDKKGPFRGLLFFGGERGIIRADGPHPFGAAGYSRRSARLPVACRTSLLIHRGFESCLSSETKKAPSGAFYFLAEREGFEPSMGINPYSLSRGAPSATRPPLREIHSNCFSTHHHQAAVGITPGILPSALRASVAMLLCSKSLPAILSNPR